MSDSSFVVTNQLLYMLVNTTNQRLLPHLEEVSLTSGQILQESGSKITDLYFPQSARFSWLLVMSNKFTIEVTSIGSKGLTGLPVVLGSDFTRTRLIAQIPGTAIKLPTEIIKKEFKKGGDFQRIVLLYTQTQLNQISQIAACRSHHDIEQRLARWLLLIDDDIQQDTLPLTQKFISMMLGVRRATITEIAISFQKQGIIKYSRGQITILDRSKLEGVTCECYDKIKAEYELLFESI